MDPTELGDLKAALDGHQVYSSEQVEDLVKRYPAGADRDQLDPLLDGCVATYRQLDEDGQVDFNGPFAFVQTKANCWLRSLRALRHAPKELTRSDLRRVGFTGRSIITILASGISPSGHG
jgi:hypothetical protein